MEKLCPYRPKQYCVVKVDQIDTRFVENVVIEKTEFDECYGDECMMWNMSFHTCSLRNSIG